MAQFLPNDDIKFRPFRRACSTCSGTGRARKEQADFIGTGRLKICLFHFLSKKKSIRINTKCSYRDKKFY